MRNSLITSVAVIAIVAPGYAQTLTPTPPPTPAPTQQEREAEARERQQLALFRDDLRRSVGAGAMAMLKQVRQESPRAELEMANPVEVESFTLPEGDLVFRVRVPTMLPTLRYAMELERARRTVVTPTSLAPTGPNPTLGTPVQALPAKPSPYVDIDPDAVYTREVKSEMLNTVIRRSGSLKVPATRFLIVAARDDGRPDPRLPSSFTEFNTVYFSIKGGDLTNFHEGRQTFEETQKLVVIREE